MPIIAAVSTAPGEGGIAIVRASGAGCLEVLKKIFRPIRQREFESHRMMYGHCVDKDGSIVDEVMAVYLAAPSTYTRQDMFEIQCHGGDVCARRILKILLAHGARIAEPGEFTRLAFMNGRIDLSKAEAIMQIISANSEAAVRAGVRQLSGGISAFIRQIVEELKNILSEIDACVDFPEEVDTEATAEHVCKEALRIAGEIDARTDERSARIVMKGADIVLSGRPNVGKSSLMNVLLKRERAIVTDIPGTTRDVLTESISIGGITVRLSDTAGMRNTADKIEQIGVRLAEKAVQEADVVILVLDGSSEITDKDKELLESIDDRYIICINKCDLEIKLKLDRAIYISAGNGCGIDDLIKKITEKLCVLPIDDGFTGERHIEAAKCASTSLKRAASGIEEGFEADTVRMDIMDALDTLCEITGENATEAVIDRVFQNFCVGK